MERTGLALAIVLERMIGVLKWLVLPVSFLLFLQWPLREALGAYSREANDLGQWLFALYVAASVTAAARAGTHLAVDSVARHYSPRARRMLANIGGLLALAPWAAFLLVSATPSIVASIGDLERFPDTGNPGYFIIKGAVWLLAAMLLASILVDLLNRPAKDSAP